MNLGLKSGKQVLLSKIPPEKIDEYRNNKLNPSWRANKEHERICDYLIWLEGVSDR